MKKRATQILAFFLLFVGQKLAANPPAWSVDATAFQFSMNLTAQVKLDFLPDNGAGNLVGVFVGNELRGVASPLVSSGTARYFVTVFSNAAAGEILNFKIYTAADDLIHPAGETLDFQRQATVGNVQNMFALSIFSDDDFPISIAAIPAQNVVTGAYFSNAYLPDFLQTIDGQPVVWTTVGTANLVATIVSGNLLNVTTASFNFAGTDSVTVTATETGTTSGFSASRKVVFSKTAPVQLPVFSAIPPQQTCEDEPFGDGDLSDFLTFPGGGCLAHSFKIAPPTGTATAPVWVQPTSPPGSMTLKVQAQFGGRNFSGNNLKIAAFRGGTLAGVATPLLVGNDKFYFLTVGKVGTGDVSFQFYDGERQFLHPFSATTTAFVPNGNSDLTVDFSPLDFSLSESGGDWSVELVDPAWFGTAAATFYARSCIDPAKMDSAQTTFARLHEADCIQIPFFQDSDGDGFGNPAVQILAATAPGGYVSSNTDCDDTKNAVHPGAPEICNFVDDNCAGGSDEGFVHVGFLGAVVNTGCPQVLSGAVNLTVSAGVAPLAYVWSSGQTTQNITNLGVGNYQVTVAGNDGCTSAQAFSVVALNNLAVSFSVINVTCFGSANGTIFSTPAGGTAPYSYLWSNGKTTKNINLLAQNTYILTMTDAVGCTKTNSQTVTQPTEVNFTLASVPNGTKHDVTLSATGGTPGYTYNRSGTTVYQTSNVFTLLSAATYIFKTKDANGCIKSRVAKVPITTPGAGNKPATGGQNFEWELTDDEAALPEEVLFRMFEVKLAEAEMLVFPNPFSENLTLVFPQIVETAGEVLIFDALGRTVFQKSVLVEKDKLLDLDIADLPRGTYLLSFLGKNGLGKKVKVVKM